MEGGREMDGWRERERKFHDKLCFILRLLVRNTTAARRVFTLQVFDSWLGRGVS